MACDLLSTRGALFVLWGVPAIEDMARIVQARRAGADEAGRPLIYVTRVPVAQPAPSAEVRKHLDRLVPVFLECFRATTSCSRARGSQPP
jgi:hypothetical protein